MSDEIILYPNPLLGDWLNFSDFVSVEIFNLQGLLLARYDHIKSIKTSLKKGIYILSISNEEYYLRKKLIKN
ncbi:MAG: T9SS type A sorting domain-containing protein [Prolixibacteraceae bacterium]|nr:T9SS type A sorting domain-containing protein [Prolixibacteraceae bacterium]